MEASRRHLNLYWIGVGATGLFATFYAIPFLLSWVFGWRPEGTESFYILGVFVPLALWIGAIVLGGVTRKRSVLLLATVPLLGVAALAILNMMYLAGIVRF